MELRRRRFGRAVRLEVDRRRRRRDPRPARARARPRPTTTSTSSTARSTSAGSGPCTSLDRPDLKDDAVAAGHAAPRSSAPTTSRSTSSPRIRDGDVLVHHPYDSFTDVGRGVHPPGGDRPQGARHQADALPHVGRQPDRRRRSSGRPSGASRWRRSSSSRPASTSRPTSTGRARWRRRASTSSTASSG